MSKAKRTDMCLCVCVCVWGGGVDEGGGVTFLLTRHNVRIILNKDH